MKHNHTATESNICEHGAYADLCITCHPDTCEIVEAAIAYTESIGVAAVDRKARVEVE